MRGKFATNVCPALEENEKTIFVLESNVIVEEKGFPRVLALVTLPGEVCTFREGTDFSVRFSIGQ